MIRIKILKNMSESLEKKKNKKKPEIRSQGPQGGNTLMSNIAYCCLLLLIVLVTSKLAPTKLLSGQKFM